MKAVGLIVEYNPFHNGHYHHLKQSKKLANADAAVAVMSGHFLQRGEPALVDKWTRAELALANGCDLVLELPVAYATSSAEWFAYGATATLHATGVVDSICFGTESGLLEPLKAAAQVIVHQEAELKPLLHKQLQLGISYPSAFSQALTQLLKNNPLWSKQPIALDQPNHTLGLHYLVALERLQSSISALTIPREQAQYHDHMPQHHHIASATAIRRLLLQQQQLDAIAPYVPAATLEILSRVFAENKVKPMQWEHFAKPLFYQLAAKQPLQLARYREMEEGLEYRFHQQAKQLSNYSVEELFNATKTKRYTKTRLQRTLLAVLLQHEKPYFSREALANGVQYIRVLGFNEKGKQLLKLMKTKASLPVIHTPAQYSGEAPYLLLDVAATGCYMQAFMPHEPRQQLADYTRAPIMLSSTLV